MGGVKREKEIRLHEMRQWVRRGCERKKREKVLGKESHRQGVKRERGREGDTDRYVRRDIGRALIGR